jgi:hypothetical protein
MGVRIGWSRELFVNGFDLSVKNNQINTNRAAMPHKNQLNVKTKTAKDGIL